MIWTSLQHISNGGVGERFTLIMMQHWQYLGVKTSSFQNNAMSETISQSYFSDIDTFHCWHYAPASTFTQPIQNGPFSLATEEHSEEHNILQLVYNRRT